MFDSASEDRTSFLSLAAQSRIINIGLYIETWVRIPVDIVACLDQFKVTVVECSKQYINRIKLSASTSVDANGQALTTSAEQCRLNNIVAGLVFNNRKPQHESDI